MASEQATGNDVNATQTGPTGDPSPSVASADSTRSAPSRWRPLAILAGIVIASTLAYSLASWARYEEFFTSNWDLGINMQLLWTNTHGYLLYESGDYEFAHVNSFLYIHPTYIAIPISFLYRILPSAATLFVLQAGVVALSAIPLYLIGRQVRTPGWVLYAGLGVYLASFPILSGILFDFHWEAFIPAEFLWTFYLWDRGRYWWAALPATLSLVTLDVFPILIIALVAYFGYPLVRAYFASPRKNLHKIWSTLRGPALPLIGLLALAVAGYGIFFVVDHYVLPSVVGRPSFPAPQSNFFLGLYWWSVSLDTVGPRLLYWLLLFAAFGFLPLVYRQRLLILSLPWAIYTVIMVPYAAYTTFGFQYSLIAVGPLAIGFVEGLGAVTRAHRPGHPSGLTSWGWLLLLLPLLGASLTSSLLLIESTLTAQWLGLAIGLWLLSGLLVLRYAARRRSLTKRSPSRITVTPRTRRRGVQVACVSAIVVLAACNVALSPLNPANFVGAGEGGYSFNYSPSPSFGYMSMLVDKIPEGATVVASDNLFPFVANNPRAYSLLWFPSAPTYLPFNATHLPEYVLLSTSQGFAVPVFLNSVLYNQSVYGIVAMLYSSALYPGSIYLFQLGYSGSSDVVQVTPFPTKTVLCGNDFALGPSGVVVAEAGTRCGTVLESRPASNLSGNNATIWYGPYSTLIAGNYTVTISLEGSISPPGPSNAPILVMNANALGTGYWYYVVIQANMVSTTQWTNFTYHFQLTEPRPQAEWRGYLAGPTVNGRFIPGYDKLNFIEIDYSPFTA